VPVSLSKIFSEFLNTLDPELVLPRGISVINPYLDPVVRKHVRTFCNKYYTSPGKRILILGINPGRFGAGITGIPFTDPFALENLCGISNNFDKKRELSSSFVYEVIDAYGGTGKCYSDFLISSVWPLGFLKGSLNHNFYDSPALVRATSGFIRQSLTKHSKMNISRNVVISYGEKNAAHLKKENDELQLFNNILTTKHPRYIMQYKRREKNRYIDLFLKTFSQALEQA